jgi:PAS domain-containing protein
MVQATEESLGPFRADEILAQLPSALLLTTAERGLLAWNARAADLLAVELRPGMPVDDLMPHEAKRQRVVQHASEVARGADMLSCPSIILCCAGGVERSLRVGIQALHEPGQPPVLLWQLDPVCSGIDGCALLDKVAEGVAIFGSTGHYVEVNAIYAQALWYGNEELLSIK